MPDTVLPDRCLLLVEGEDAEHFLEGLITADLPGPGEVVGAALLTPQGKLLFTFLVSRHGDGFALECDRGERDALIQRLTLYKLRAKVTLTPNDLPVTASAGEGLVDRRHPEMGMRLYGETPANGSPDAYRAHRAALGVLEGPDEVLANKDFPHDVALDLTGSVSFAKGCFVGQEVVSRVRHRGTARRRPVLVADDAAKPGDAITIGEREIGTVRLAAGGNAVAVLRIDQVKGPASIQDRPVTLALPPYATYSLGSES